MLNIYQKLRCNYWSISTFVNSGRQKKVCQQLQLQGFAEEVKVNAGLKINYSRDQEIECV